MVVLGLIIFIASALARPNLIRLSTFKREDSDVNNGLKGLNEIHSRQSATGAQQSLGAQDTIRGSSHGASGSAGQSAGSSSLQ